MTDHIPDAGRMVVLQTIAAMLDHPNVFMGGPTQRSLRRAGDILAVVAPLIRRAALEEAAKYHDEAADGERDLASQCGAQNDRRGNEMHRWLEQEHILSAAAIRALT
jgi:hypothetical protein